MMGVFIDTFIILNLTAFVIIITRSVTPDQSLIGTALTQAGFSSVFGEFGEANIKYLFGKKAVKIYALLVCVCIILGSAMKVTLVWDMADCFNGLMVIPNLIGLLALTTVIKSVHKDYQVNFKKK